MSLASLGSLPSLLRGNFAAIGMGDGRRGDGKRAEHRWTMLAGDGKVAGRPSAGAMFSLASSAVQPHRAWSTPAPTIETGWSRRCTGPSPV
ncbi:hypothetical protein [Phreatobacter sp. AB_2022a]|uniref:hypothetical protein n=1 Tax=Phreatobacter sp. AB_2022a TaxID=3003134 RepID=UPI002286E6A8|nr:hypothetical protein [Phreatobacter sp. AB_2022a]MCZ0735643.1 hypothetical protein [Phreatobacter sp. AB_2022a]